MLSIALIDVLGLTYDGSTLSSRGLGGSESAIILMGKELAAIGFKVTVFNSCKDTQAAEGIYNDVKYIDVSNLDEFNEYKFDIVIGSRSVVPFIPEDLWSDPYLAQYKPQRYKYIVENALFRAVWMHDTFCNGDQYLEKLLVSNRINEIFTLSDFHTNYVTSCDHGGRRMFEVLKNKVFQTRNGIVNYKESVDINSKDPFLCVYNASVTKGLFPLVKAIWPKIKEAIPEAKLKVIGGYYRFRENAEPDQQEKEWRKLATDPVYAKLDIEFTGIIRQSEIAEIYSKASYTLHPGAFPETFGISSLESLNYNTPLVTTRFGALEETAVDQACYLIDYPIEPNGLYPNINAEQQVNKYVAVVLRAMQDKYLHQQKMYSCNLVKGISTWDTVALQWKQHFYKIFGIYLSRKEFIKVSDINNSVRKVFGRRFCNYEDNYTPKVLPEQKIVVVTPVYNSENYIIRCIESVIHQDYSNWIMVIINDASTDRTMEAINNYTGHPNLIIINNPTNMGAVYNQITAINKYAGPEDIIMLLDGDDSLVNNNQLFTYYNNLYSNDATEFTYGSCWSMVDRIPLIAQPYPEEVKRNKSYRQHLFNWNMPYTHLRTFKAHLLQSADESNFKDESNNWYKAGGDCSIFYTALENANPDKIKVISDIVYNYNDLNPLNDYKINGEEQTKNANRILGKKYNKEKFSVIIPTMWKATDILIPFLQKLEETELVGEIILIDNNPSKAPSIPYVLSKLKVHKFEKNIYVNPAWNYGVKVSQYNKLCIANDDITFDTNVFEKVYEYIVSDKGVSGLCPGETNNFNQVPITTKTIDIVPWKQGDHTFGFGSLMFIHKDSWINIPEDLKVYYGDNFIFDSMLKLNKPNYLITNMDHYTKWAQTTSDSNIVPEGMLAEETIIYENIMHRKTETPKTNTVNVQKEKTILIAIPTNMGIKPETFKAIYDLKVPEGYKTVFQYFYGYQIDQIRNLIAEWGKHYDYLFSVDSDISFEPDTLIRLLMHNKPIVGGIYIQRKPGEHTLEVYGLHGNISYEELVGKSLVEVEACGFGCLLIKSEVLQKMQYPHFVYKSAIDHKYTISEDIYFCKKAAQLGFKTYVDPSITCNHHGDWVYKVNTAVLPKKDSSIDSLNRLKELSNMRLLPKETVEYMRSIKSKNPKVIYDIGACVLHWTNEAKQIWPEATYVAFEAMNEVEPIYKQANILYHLGVLSDKDGKQIEFYQNLEHPGGNSYYKENEEINPNAKGMYDTKVTKISTSLDSILLSRDLPLPDLIKIDVQGAELDILKGAQYVLSHCKDIIIELQTVEYNKGAPNRHEVIEYLNSIGFKLVKQITNNPIYDGDYHFTKV